MTQAGVTDGATTGGYTCPRCQGWVGLGIPHYCYGEFTFSSCQNDTERVAQALDRITELLEQIKRRLP